jgi:hypothetical protein
LEDSDVIEAFEGIRLEDSDVFKAFPDVKFTISRYRGDVSTKKAIDFHKENQNVLLDFRYVYEIKDAYKVYSRNLEK